jgi:ABC-type transport system involved in multi-copper enzyme maturation permease subunit
MDLTRPTRRQRLRRALLHNPVTVKELRSRMRGARAFTVLTIYLILISAFLSLVYLTYATAANQPFGPDPRQAGKPIFGVLLFLQLLLVIFLGPSFTVGAVTGEKERQTYDLLRTTLLSAHALVFGKLLSALSFILLLILATVPLMSIAFLLGGVAPVEIAISQLLVLVAAVTFALIGLFFSTLLRSTLAASVITFGVSLFITAGLPTIVLLLAAFFNAAFFSTSFSGIQEVILAYLGLFLAAFNLPATIIASEVFLVNQNAVFFFTESIGGYRPVLFSPWWVHVILYSILNLVLYWLCVRVVRRVPNK